MKRDARGPLETIVDTNEGFKDNVLKGVMVTSATKHICGIIWYWCAWRRK
jgi:hypothetical protein